MFSMKPLVADMNHANAVSFTRIATAGIRGVIHKAIQGHGFHDPAYYGRRVQANEVGLLWGAYAFNTGEDPVEQAEYFLEIATPDAATRLCLDFEDNKQSEMSIEQAAAFLDHVDQKTGRLCTIYGGNRIKEQLQKAGDAVKKMVTRDGKRPLWLSEYGPKANLPEGWAAYDLWQCWADGFGPKPVPHVPGLERNADLSVYAGSIDQLRAGWAGPVPAQ